MDFASSQSFAQEILAFLATWIGQVVLALASVLFLVIAKNLSRPPGGGSRAIHSDDFAISFDLLVLAVITSLGYAVSQAETAKAANNQAATDGAQGHEISALMVALGAVLFLFVAALVIWRFGQCSQDERDRWRTNNPRRVDEPPRFKPLFGLAVPGAMGLFMLIIAIKQAAAR